MQLCSRIEGLALTPRLAGGGREGGGTLLHFHELLHATEDASSGMAVLDTRTTATAMMDEARALFDWMHGIDTKSGSAMRSSTTGTSCVALEMVPRQARQRDEAAAFYVLHV